MKRVALILIMTCLFTGSVNALQPGAQSDNASLDTSSQIDNLVGNPPDNKFEQELKAFQEIQRESEYMKLRLKNKELMDKLGIHDRDDIFDDADNSSFKKNKASKNIFLIATFKKGKGPVKARVYIPGKGIAVIKKGDVINTNMKILEIKDGSARIMIVPEGDIYTIEPTFTF